MDSYKIVLSSDNSFVDEFTNIENALISRIEVLTPGAKYALEYFSKIREFMNGKDASGISMHGFANFRPITDLIGGEEFLESPLGKRFIDVCFYFGHVYWPNRMKG